MVSESDIEFIISTYELPVSLRDKILVVAKSRLNELSITNFDEAYNYLGRLVDCFEVSFEERRHVRIDKELGLDLMIGTSGNLGIKSALMDALSYDAQEIDSGKDLASLSGEDVIDILNELESTELAVLKQLIGKVGLEVNVDPQTLVKRVHIIQKKLAEIGVMWPSKDGRIVMPQRPIVDIQFNPLYVKFGRRIYGGDPLSFYRAHLDVYGEMTRKQLKLFDGGLYKALHKSGQINLAIPETYQSHALRGEVHQKILDCYEECGANASLAEKELPVSRGTIIKYWRQAGLETMSTNNLLPSKIEAIRRTYEYVGSISQTAEIHGVGRVTASRCVKRQYKIDK